MSSTRWQDDWRPQEPRPDFAQRVMAELSRAEAEGGDGWGARTARQRRAGWPRRGSCVAVLGLAALLLTGAALGSFGQRSFLQPLSSHSPSEQEGPPITKQCPAPRLHLASPRAPIEPAPGRPRTRRLVPPDLTVADPPEPVRGPIHYPACHCSSGAVVCSCVD